MAGCVQESAWQYSEGAFGGDKNAKRGINQQPDTKTGPAGRPDRTKTSVSVSPSKQAACQRQQLALVTRGKD